MMPAPDRKHPKYQAASMLMQILGGSESDLLHWDLVDRVLRRLVDGLDGAIILKVIGPR